MSSHHAGLIPLVFLWQVQQRCYGHEVGNEGITSGSPDPQNVLIVLLMQIGKLDSGLRLPNPT
jgi:hypothetical protein